MTERPELDPILAREDGRPCSQWLLCGCSADLGCDCGARRDAARMANWLINGGRPDYSDLPDDPELWTLSDEVATLAGIRRKERL